MPDRPKLIVHNATVAARTDEISRNADYIEGLPIDGMVVNSQ